MLHPTQNVLGEKQMRKPMTSNSKFNAKILYTVMCLTVLFSRHTPASHRNSAPSAHVLLSLQRTPGYSQCFAMTARLLSSPAPVLELGAAMRYSSPSAAPKCALRRLPTADGSPVSNACCSLLCPSVVNDFSREAADSVVREIKAKGTWIGAPQQ